MNRNSLQPLDAGVCHSNVEVEALCDRTSNESDALLLEQLDQLLVLRHQPIDLLSFSVEKGRDCPLLLDWWGGEEAVFDVIATKTVACDAIRRDLKLIPCSDRRERPSKESPIEIDRRSHESEVIAAENVRELRGNYCRHSDVRPRLRVLRDEHIADTKRKAPHLLRC